MALGGKKIGLVLLFLLVAALVLSACVPRAADPMTPFDLSGDVDAAVQAQRVAAQYLDAWQVEDYAAMYGLLTSLSQDAFSLESFSETYLDVAVELTLEGISFQVLSAIAEKHHAEVAYRVVYDTLLLGEIVRDMVMNLTPEGNTWRIQWENSLIFPDLSGGNALQFVRQIPSRGRIFDHNGAPLAAYEDAIAIGIVPGEMLQEQAALVYETLAEISIYSVESLQDIVESTPDDWYLPVITLSQRDAAEHIEKLRGLAGVRMDEFRARYYVDGGVAPHVLGYTLYIPEEELDDYLRLGYSRDERIGVSGLEAVYEAELSGQRGGSLYLVDSNGKVQNLIAASEPVPGQSVYTTLDKELQMRLQASLGDLRASIVVVEVDTGRILALVSNPGFDPNAFDLTGADRSLLDSYFTDENQPLFNRATQGQYPLGSVFKTITMAAGMENGLYRANSSFYCGQQLWVCDSVWLDDWTLAHGVGASGELTLIEGLMRSCNPWFYRIGENLFVEGMEDALSEMAMGFGLGEPTGVEIGEAAGNIPQTAGTCVNSAQMSIGQGEILVTPLQVATFFGALANGGTLYRPTLIDRLTSSSGEIMQAFEPETAGTLPISDETLAAIQEGLRMVVEESRGTGYWALQGLEVPVSGKTGTAQTPTGNSHAWFAGYSRQNDPDRPDIAVAVIIENGGEGSVMAAPVFMRAVSLYFSDYQDYGRLMPWEVEPYITELPEPTATPHPMNEPV